MAKVKLPDLPYALPSEKQACPLCGRLLGAVHVDEHHLVPKSEGGRAKHKIHRVCHTKIHSLFTEQELARNYASWDALLAHADIQSFVKWVARKPASYIDRNARAARKGSR